MSERHEPAPVCSSTAARNLADHYRRNGESEHVAAVEAAVTDEWQTTEQILSAAAKSTTWGRNALEYLAAEGRIERGTEPMPDRLVYGLRCNWRYVWRLCPYEEEARPYEEEPVLAPE